MKIKQVDWKEDYNTGIEIVDNAHKKLFSITRKVTELITEESDEKSKYACIETIKFLKSYTLKHFAEEEEYMLSTDYEGYEMHKHLHDNLRDKTLPFYEEMLEKSDYSNESIYQFMGVITGWLVGHIMIEDRAITGRTISRHSLGNLENGEIVSKVLDEFLRKTFDLSAKPVNSHYQGEPLGNVFNCETVYKHKDGKTEKVLVTADRSFIMYVAGKSLGTGSNTIDKVAVETYMQIVRACTKRLLHYTTKTFDFEFVSHRAPSEVEVQSLFSLIHPPVSILFSTEEGRIGIIIE